MSEIILSNQNKPHLFKTIEKKFNERMWLSSKIPISI